MRKYGKYEKMPDGTRAKQPAVKGVLLQTYFTSLICLVLCVSMFFGTSYAWFTSEVENTGNEIYIGTLDAKLEMLKKDIWVDVEENPDVKLYDNSIFWEPGYTSLETIRISNKGDLSFRYALTFTDGMLNGVENDEELIKVAQYFTVYVHAGEFTDSDPKPASFAEIRASAQSEDGTWRMVRMGKDPATLADILEKEIPVLSGNVEEKTEIDTYTIALHMLEIAGEGETEEDSIQLSKALMGQKINLNVKLTAYQRTYEQDAFDSSYDLKAHVTNLGKLDIEYTKEIGGNAETMKLDAAYQFQPVEGEDEAQNVPYKNYVADFAVWADRDIKANSIALAGYYSLFCEGWNDGKWIVLTIDSDEELKTTDINETNPIRLVEGLYYPVTYELLCTYGNDGVGFLCGLAERTENGGVEAGIVITVELRLYEVDESRNETGNYIVAGRYTYTFE